MTPTLFELGVSAECTDGPCGEVTEVVVDASTLSVTHLVVEPTHRSGLGRLVPVAMVAVADGGVRLACSLEAFTHLAAAEETLFLPGNNGGYGGYSPGQMVVLPHFRLGDEPATLHGAPFDASVGFQPVVSDLVPDGKVTIGRGSPVHATDGEIGEVQAVLAEAPGHRVSAVVLREGHLWGRKRVAIPAAAVTRTDGGLAVALTRDAIGELPAVEF